METFLTMQASSEPLLNGPDMQDNEAVGSLLSSFLCQTPEEAENTLSIAMPYYQHGSLHSFIADHVVNKVGSLLPVHLHASHAQA